MKANVPNVGFRLEAVLPVCGRSEMVTTLDGQATDVLGELEQGREPRPGEGSPGQMARMVGIVAALRDP